MTVLAFILKLFLIFLSIVFVLIALLSIIPFDYYINIKYDQGIALRIKIIWAKFLGISGTYDNAEAFASNLIIFNREIALKSNNIKKKTRVKDKVKKNDLKKKSKFDIREILDKSF